MTQPIYLYRARLNRVIDGDTVVLDLDVGFRITATITVRVRGLFAAESHEPGGPDATARAEAILRQAKTLIVATTKTKTGNDVKTLDRYVGDIWADGQLLADVLRVVPEAGIGAVR